MKKQMAGTRFKFGLLFTMLMGSLLSPPQAFSSPEEFVDAYGMPVTIRKPPSRVVSLVPGITEIIFKLGAGNAVAGITYQSTYPSETALTPIVGGFFSPSLGAIEAIQPEMIFLSSLHARVKERFSHSGCTLINLDTRSLQDIFRNIDLLGKIFNKEQAARGLKEQIEAQFRVIDRKVANIPKAQRKRVIRLMGQGRMMTPGDDSFQNEMIKAAGGIPPELGKKGRVVEITREEWMNFNPQFIYGCVGDRETAKKFLNRPGWRDVDAVRNGNIFYFPCDLTCRASSRTGDFVSWLSSTIYTQAFSRNENQVLPESVFESRKVADIDLDYIEDARILCSIIHDFENKTFMINFKKPMAILSTLEGERKEIAFIGNHYSPSPCWRISHRSGLESERDRIYQVIGKSYKNASFLFTGVDMDKLTITRKRFREMEVYAAITAGVKSNAMRVSEDEGGFYESGTINIILLSNMKLTPRAMTRALISATEAKTAALQDLDIRSHYTPLVNQATGTGTDNMIVVQGSGRLVDNAGGHSKMGELIATAVYEGVKKAIYKQNGFVKARNIFQRLAERNIGISETISMDAPECGTERIDLAIPLEELLLQPIYASFVASSLAISDYYERGLVGDLTVYHLLCKRVAEEISGRKIDGMIDLIAIDKAPPVLRMSLNAILNGLYFKMR